VVHRAHHLRRLGQLIHRGCQFIVLFQFIAELLYSSGCIQTSFERTTSGTGGTCEICGVHVSAVKTLFGVFGLHT